METFLTYLTLVHVLAGSVSLLSGLLAFTLRANTPRHRPFGKIYFWSMSLVFVTALFLSLIKQLPFFFFIAVFSYYSVSVAYRALKLKDLHLGRKPAFIDVLIQLLAAMIFLVAVVVALFHFGRGSSILILVFGSMGLLGVYRTSLLLFRGPKETAYWLKMHIGHMMGSYIGALTAFLVNQTDHIPAHPLILWLGPTVLLTPLIVMELRKVKTEKL